MIVAFVRPVQILKTTLRIEVETVTGSSVFPGGKFMMLASPVANPVATMMHNTRANTLMVTM